MVSFSAMKTLLQLIVMLVLFMFTAQFTVASAEDAKPLTNADVIKMLDSGLPESVILSKVQASAANYDTSTDAIIELSKKGVSEKVLNAILNPQSGSSEGTKSEPAKDADAPAAMTGDKPSALSYGTAAGLVKKGVTTQMDILNLFGGADVMTTDRDGTEVWMYDKKTSTVASSGASSSSNQETSEASQMAKYLGIPFIAGMGSANQHGKAESTGTYQNSGEVKSSSKTITFIIKFNEDKTVKDFAVRQASY